MRQNGFAPIIIILAVALVAIAGGYFFFKGIKGIPVLQAPAPDVSAWQIYNNYFYGFEIEYPKDWQFAVAGAQTGSDYITGFEFGHPLAGQLIATSSGNPSLPFLGVAPAYVLQASVGHDTSTSTLKSVAIAWAARLGAKFEKGFDVRIGAFKGAHNAKIGAYDAYELYGVDHGSMNPKTEEILVIHNGVAMSFGFPVAETPADQYNAAPAENNIIARQIINTLIFTK
jgi:hypothetical protein